MSNFKCPRCGNLSVIWLPSKKQLCCDECRDYKKGIIDIDYSEDIVHAYQVKKKRDD